MSQSVFISAAWTSHLSHLSTAAARLGASRRALTIISPGGGELSEQIRDIRTPRSHDEKKNSWFSVVKRKKVTRNPPWSQSSCSASVKVHSQSHDCSFWVVHYREDSFDCHVIIPKLNSYQLRTRAQQHLSDNDIHMLSESSQLHAS